MAENIPAPQSDDVYAYFQEKGVKGACPICGNETWMLFTHGTAAGTAQMVLERDGNIFGSHLRLLTVTCTRCTFVRQHLLNPFLEWLKTRNTGAKQP